MDPKNLDTDPPKEVTKLNIEQKIINNAFDNRNPEVVKGVISSKL